MHETIRLDGEDVPLTKESIMAIMAENRRQFEELKGRLDAMGLELEKVQMAKAALKDPTAIDAKVEARIKLMDQCRTMSAFFTPCFS